VSAQWLTDTARALVAGGRGLLAMDESNPTCNARFAPLWIPQDVLRALFGQLYTQRLSLEGLLVKPNMVLPGSACPRQESVDEVANATVACLLRAVPAPVPGIAFLSGGQPGELASARLNAMNARFRSRLPWALAFSFARAIQQPALEIWRGEQAHVSAAQRALCHRARCNSAARRGEYGSAMEGA
jgi:fructose-bisphosphate aldolase class I